VIECFFALIAAKLTSHFNNLTKRWDAAVAAIVSGKA
jgi:hypothetical protein